MPRKSILGIILFLLTLTLVTLQGSPIDTNIYNHQLSNQIKQGQLGQTSISQPVISETSSDYSQTVTTIKKQPKLINISTSQSQPTYKIIDILWLLLCSGLVFLTQPGFMCLESGLTWSKNSINVAIKNLTDFGISVACFWGFGFALMFGVSYSGFSGYSKFFLATDLRPFDAAFFLFQACSVVQQQLLSLVR